MHDDWFREPTPHQRMLRGVLLREAAAMGARFGVDRRAFLGSSMGAMAALAIAQQAEAAPHGFRSPGADAYAELCERAGFTRLDQSTAHDWELIEAAGRTVAISHPQKVLFPGPKHTKLDLARYYLAVADGALRGAGGRPNMLVRYPNGIGAEFFYQKRAPTSRREWVEVVKLEFPE